MPKKGDNKTNVFSISKTKTLHYSEVDGEFKDKKTNSVDPDEA